MFDLYAGKPVKPLSEIISIDDANRIAGIGQDVVIAAAVAKPVHKLIDAFIDGFFAIYGDLPAAEILDDLDLTREILADYAVTAAPAPWPRSPTPENSTASSATTSPLLHLPEVLEILPARPDRR